MRSEKEAVALEDWFMAGMSARSLFYMYGKTYNSPEELSCIKRAVDYFLWPGWKLIRTGYFKWSKDGTRTVTCSLVILNKKHFVFDELRNNRRFEMKRLKE
ncbi:MAG: hypothetical protein J6N54_07230 [Bacteroidales bacterium]|nr:hypothetical protein [Bacteroidales bacterium]